MPKYIERDALEVALNHRLNFLMAENGEYDHYTSGFDEAVTRVENFPAADVFPVRHGRCDVCSGNAVLTQDADNGYSLEIDAEQQEAAVWYGDECLAVFHIDFCPNCGAKMELEDTNG